MSRLVLGLDCGLTVTKAVLFDENARARHRQRAGGARVPRAALGASPAAASGMHEGLKEAAEAMSGEGARFESDEGRAARYDRVYGVYKEIYPSLRPLFPRLADALEDRRA